MEIIQKKQYVRMSGNEVTPLGSFYTLYSLTINSYFDTLRLKKPIVTVFGFALGKGGARSRNISGTMT